MSKEIIGQQRERLIQWMKRKLSPCKKGRKSGEKKLGENKEKPKVKKRRLDAEPRGRDERKKKDSFDTAHKDCQEGKGRRQWKKYRAPKGRMESF